ncbi:gst-8, partial [Pristionchus pacificus]
GICLVKLHHQIVSLDFTMPSYKLTYFPIRGRAEVARQLFHLAGVPFEDIRIPGTEWPALKDKTPFGQLPLLEVDGKPLPQSFAISRYLAKEFGFAGNSPFESAWVDAIADQHKDYSNEIRPALGVFMGRIEGDKEQLLKDVAIPTRDKYFVILERFAKENGSNGHFVGSSLTWVDLLIADHVSILLKYLPDFLEKYPTIVQTVKQIESTPKLKEWIGKRPDTAF